MVVRSLSLADRCPHRRIRAAFLCSVSREREFPTMKDTVSLVSVLARRGCFLRSQSEAKCPCLWLGAYLRSSWRLSVKVANTPILVQSTVAFMRGVDLPNPEGWMLLWHFCDVAVSGTRLIDMPGNVEPTGTTLTIVPHMIHLAVHAYWVLVEQLPLHGS